MIYQVSWWYPDTGGTFQEFVEMTEAEVEQVRQRLERLAATGDLEELYVGALPEATPFAEFWTELGQNEHIQAAEEELREADAAAGPEGTG